MHSGGYTVGGSRTRIVGRKKGVLHQDPHNRCNDLSYFCVFITNLWREESSCLKGGQAYISQSQYDMEEENSPGQSIPDTNRKNPYQMTNHKTLWNTWEGFCVLLMRKMSETDTLWTSLYAESPVSLLLIEIGDILLTSWLCNAVHSIMTLSLISDFCSSAF